MKSSNISKMKGKNELAKMQEIADKLALTTPELSKFINPDSVLKPHLQ